MGMCGADPVTIVDGMENLSPMDDDERATLERMGLGQHVRLACMCRVSGAVCVSLEAMVSSELAAPREPIVVDELVAQVVIIGNGIAGVMAADTIRRHHPDCAIHLIGREKRPLSTRMAISRLIDGRSAMSGLYLQPDVWYEERQITSWLSTQVTQIDKTERQVILATGEALPFDRMILACGRSSFVSATTLKVVGVDVTSIGRVCADAGEGELVLEDPKNQRSRKRVIADGKIVGAILLGCAKEATAVTAAIKQAWDVTDILPALLVGRWEVLGQRMAQPTAV